MVKSLPIGVIFQNTIGQFMRESNILADNVAKNLPVRVLLQDTEDQFTKESNILVDNVT